MPDPAVCSRAEHTASLPFAGEGRRHHIHAARRASTGPGGCLLVEALRCDPRDVRCRDKLEKLLNPHTSKTPYFWSRSAHPVIFSIETNLLFTTLLLGLQRQETVGVLPLAHHSLLEDMLEGWTWADSANLKHQ